ncbi:hypothetical protein [Nocardia ignorata]|nr:hypothetical protein [Nocardia ignorata]
MVCGVIAIGVVMYGLIGDDPSDPQGLATVAAGLLPGAARALLFWQSRGASTRADKFAERIAATAVLLSTAFPELTGREIWRMAESKAFAHQLDSLPTAEVQVD